MDLKRLLSIKETAEYFGVPVATLWGWRYEGIGPRSFKVGRHIRYRWEDIEEWLARQASDAARPRPDMTAATQPPNSARGAGRHTRDAARPGQGPRAPSNRRAVK